MELNLSTYLLVPLPPSLENWWYTIYHFFSVSGPFDNFLCIIPKADPEIEEGWVGGWVGGGGGGGEGGGGRESGGWWVCI